MPLVQRYISYGDLLKKVERHVIMVDLNLYCHEIEAIVKSHGADMMRMKITVDNKLQYLLSVVDVHALYTSICARVGSSSQISWIYELVNAQHDALIVQSVVSEDVEHIDHRYEC